MAAAPASAAACSGTSGVTVVVDTGSSISTTCASGDPSTALKALTAVGYSVTYPQQYPGSVVCRINGYPESDPCVRMPPGDAYWAFFHAKRGGSWVYSSSGVATYNPAPGTVVGFRFGSGQQPRIAPPAPTKTSAPAPTTTKPKPTTSTPEATTPKATSGPTTGTTGSTPRPSASAPTTTAHALGERHGIRLGEPVAERDRPPVGDPERHRARARGRPHVRGRRRRQRQRPGHVPRRCRPRRPRRRWGRLGRVEATRLTR